MFETIDNVFLIRLLINSISLLLLIRVCYYKFSRHRGHAASFMLFGTGVFLVTRLLHATDISMGFAFGLFAVFSMLRYRTESMSTKDMTYLFLTITIALLAAVSSLTHLEMVMMNAFIFILTYITETNLLLPIMNECEVRYEKIENITPSKKDILLADLRDRTGLNIKHVEVVLVDFLRDTSTLKIHYTPNKTTK